MEITSEVINNFLYGFNPLEHVVAIECDYQDDKASVIYVNEKEEKRIKLMDFKPFAWVKHGAAIRMFGGDKRLLKKKLFQYGIKIKALQIAKEGEEPHDRLRNGYRYLYQATHKMSFQSFLMFFQEAGTPIYERKKKTDEPTVDDKEIICCSPIEQFMIESGIRLFKGYDNYDDLKRMSWDIETTGLDPHVDRIEQIGIRTNKGFHKVIKIEGNTEEEKNRNELLAIDEAVRIMAEEKPDTLFGHNTEQFDWNFFIVRCIVLGTTLEDISLKYFRHPIYKRKKESILKLGGEMETYFPTVMWGVNILDSIFAVRRAQALNSDFESANLKYATRYLDLKKPNRVYVPGNEISTVWHVTDKEYAFNDENGDWYKITDEKPLKEGYERQSGKYIVERYLLDDVWEADKVELTLNGQNFAIAKMLPTSFSRVCTMGTAGIWRLIMQAWSYEHDLAIPATEPKRRFTGGLSRLLKTGYVKNLCKNDYNSLYPSIVLTWNIKSPLDITDVMLHLLNHILTERERLKGIKAEYGAKSKATKKEIAEKKEKGENVTELQQRYNDELATKQAADSQQLAFKCLGNSFFGSYSASNIFNWAYTDSAEMVTCIGRQSLRLMLAYFKRLNYEPIVGDSFTSNTPIFIKYDSDYPVKKYRGLIDIKSISEIFDANNSDIDILGREYDVSEKHFKVLCRSGWVTPSYLYRHKTEKNICKVHDDKSSIDVTEDHSIFNKDKKKIKPSEIKKDTKMEYSENTTWNDSICKCSIEDIKTYQKAIKNGKLDRIPLEILNADRSVKKAFIRNLNMPTNPTKTFIAGIMFLKRTI